MEDIQTIALKLEESLKRNETVVFGCSCSINYSGRAESFLPLGDRIIIIKADKTLLVHQPEGSNPVNYMKADSSHKIVIDEDGVFLKSRNLALKEYLDIKIEKIYFFNYSRLEDSQSIMINGTEKDMTSMLYNNPELIESGFKPLSNEEHTKYGFIDIFGYDKDNILTVVECKRYIADLKAVDQLRRYVEKIKKSKGLAKVRGVLAAPSISPNAKQMLQDFGYKFVSVRPPKFLERFDKKQKTLDGF
jgi:hypothetical protein